MKFLNIALFAGAVAAQASVISDAIANIQSKTEALDSAVNAFSGPSDITALQGAATAVIDAINQGNTNVQGIDPVDSTGALALIDPINALAGTVDTAVNDLISKQSALSAEADVVNQNLNSILDATNTFASTTYTKLPTELVPTARNLVQPIIDDLNRAIAAFPAGSGGGSTSSSAVSSSETATATSGSASATVTAPSYSVSATATESASSTLVTSASVSVVVPPTSVSPPITSQTGSPAPYNPNGASQLSGGFAAVVVAAAVAVAAF